MAPMDSWSFTDEWVQLKDGYARQVIELRGGATSTGIDPVTGYAVEVPEASAGRKDVNVTALVSKLDGFSSNRDIATVLVQVRDPVNPTNRVRVRVKYRQDSTPGS